MVELYNKLPHAFYELMAKNGLLGTVEKMLNPNNTIPLDYNDFIAFSNKKYLTYASDEIQLDIFKILKPNVRETKNALMLITANHNLTMKKVLNYMSRIRRLNDDVNIKFGVCINDELGNDETEIDCLLFGI